VACHGRNGESIVDAQQPLDDYQGYDDGNRLIHLHERRQNQIRNKNHN
jgi:hypothetical protein